MIWRDKAPGPFLTSDEHYAPPLGFEDVCREEALQCHLSGHGVPIYARILKRNGISKIIEVCGSCGTRLSYLDEPYRLHPNFEEYPVVRNYLDGTACARCGRYDAGVETHHWAPHSLFRDADEWPTDDLCRPCHRLWHRTMRSTQR